MGKNLSGIYKSYANKKSKYRNVIDVSDLPTGRGLSKYTEKEMQKFIDEIDNRLAKINRGVKRNRKTTNKNNNKNSNRISNKLLDEILKEANFKRNQFGSTKNVNVYLGSTDVGEFQSLAELNEMISDFGRIKGEITGKDITKIAKKYKMTQKQYALALENKLKKFHLETYKNVLNYYGITEKEIEKRSKYFYEADFRLQDKFLKIIQDFAKGKEKYLNLDDEYEHNQAKDNFFREFDKIIRLGDK